MNDINPSNFKESIIALKKRFAGNRQFYLQMVKLFFETSKDKLDAINEAIQSGNLENIGSHAHFIKGGAANIGASRIGQIAEEMEQLEGSEDVDGAQDLFQELLVELKEFEEFSVMIGD